MSTILSPVPSPQPLPVALPHVLLQKPERDATTQAVLRYLEAERRASTGSAAENREHADAFDHLVAICYLAVRPYFLRDRYGSVTVEQTPQFSNVDGRRTGYAARKEGSALDVTREWIQQRVLQFLAPYCTKSHRELIAAADHGKFRYLGLSCRQRLKQIVYRQYKR
jgi:hypothetical protein